MNSERRTRECTDTSITTYGTIEYNERRVSSWPYIIRRKWGSIPGNRKRSSEKCGKQIALVQDLGAGYMDLEVDKVGHFDPPRLP